MSTFKGSFTPGGLPTNTNHAITWTGGPPSVGDTIVVFAHNTSALDNITGVTDSAGNTYVSDYDDVANSEGRNVFRCSSIVGVPTTININASATQNIFFAVSAYAGMAAAGSVFESATVYVEGASTTTHNIPYATTNPNDLVLMFYRGSTDLGTVSNLTQDGSWAQLPHARNASDSFYLLDAGAAGSKQFRFTAAFCAMNVIRMVYKSAVTDPTVSTVTGTTVTEGGNIVFTVTLSGATNRTTNYAASFSGTATSADYNNALGSATYSDGVTASGSDFVVPSGVSSFTVTIATTQDALDEDNETLVLRVGGVDSTGGTITDDDATPALLIPGPVTVDSGDSVVASYTLGAVSGRVTQARLVLTDGTATGGTDYTNTFPAATLSDGVTISAGVLSIPAGVGSFTITIPTAA